MAKRKLTFNVRLSPAVVDEIDQLVANDRYASRSDLVSRAVYELLQRENMRPLIRDEVRAFLLSEEGRGLIAEMAKTS